RSLYAVFFVACPGHHRSLPSFPTRRSSDLLVNLGAAIDVVRLRREQLLQDVRCAISFERPNFHFAEALAAELRLAAERQGAVRRSEEHTSELQSRRDLVCRLLLEKKK